MTEKTSYKQILKSTGVVGGAQVFTIIIGIVKTKIIATLLGPAGVGIAGLLQSTIDLIKNATGFGINFSGVKNIAEAQASDDDIKIAKSITILRKWSTWTGLLGLIITLVLCIPLSVYTFGNNSYAISIAILSVVLLIGSVSAGQLALLQGLRQIGSLAKATIIGSILGFFITIPLYWWLGVKGIVPAMILTALSSLAISWSFAHKIEINKPNLSIKDTFNGGISMAKLGFFIVITGFMATATMYVIRSFVAKTTGVGGVGMFQASWNISNLYIGIILNAMLTDFFPRLSAVSTDKAKLVKLTNEQAKLTLILGSPFIIAIIVFASIIIKLLYSSAFTSAIIILQWQMVGSFFVLIVWPLGVLFLAMGKGLYSIITDTIWNAFFLLAVFFGWKYVNIEILGIAYCVASFLKIFFVYFYVRQLCPFQYERKNYYLISVYTLLVLFSILIVKLLSDSESLYFGLVIFLFSLLFSYYELKKIVDLNLIVSGVLKKLYKSKL
jgi:O-antigen/teichoic acid export membrane protein